MELKARSAYRLQLCGKARSSKQLNWHRCCNKPRNDATRNPVHPASQPQPEVLAIKRAVEKAEGDETKAIKLICKHFHVRSLSALPHSLRATAAAALEGKL
jgi:hypothetical protein